MSHPIPHEPFGCGLAEKPRRVAQSRAQPTCRGGGRRGPDARRDTGRLRQLPRDRKAKTPAYPEAIEASPDPPWLDSGLALDVNYGLGFTNFGAIVFEAGAVQDVLEDGSFVGVAGFLL